MIQVLDNFLPDLLFKVISEDVMSSGFKWNAADTNSLDQNRTFAHLVDPNENNYLIGFTEIISAYVAAAIGHPTDLQSLLRVRYALIHRDIQPRIHSAHRDQSTPHIAALLYLNDSDGDTYFYEDDKKTIIKQVSPKANRLAIFDGMIYHSSSTPVNNPLRYAVNFNFEV